MKTYPRWTVVGLALLLSSLTASAITVSDAKRGSTTVLNADDVDVKPQPIKRTAPTYPPALRAAKAEGTVGLEIVINVNGDVVDAQVAASDDIRLNESALAAVKQWKYKPAKNRGVVVNCRIPVLLVFSSTN